MFTKRLKLVTHAKNSPCCAVLLHYLVFVQIFGIGCATGPHPTQFESSPMKASRKADPDSNLSLQGFASPSGGLGSSARRKTQNKSRAARGENEIAPGFLLQIVCMEDSTLTGKFRVDFEGDLKLPYNIEIAAEGLTLPQLKEKMTESYKNYFKTPPNLSMSIAERNLYVEVGGLVDKPGHFLVKPTSSIDEIISTAGGLQKTANVRYVRIDQSNHIVSVKLSDYYSGAKNLIPKWRGGETIFFQSEREEGGSGSESEGAYVQLIGEFKNPGEYLLKREADFYYYLTKAGGPTERANLGKIELLHGDNGRRHSKMFDLDSPSDLLPIQGGDVVLIHPDRSTKTERTVGLIGGLVAIANTILLTLLLFVRQ